MFIHNFKYTFKILFKSKMLIFWTFAFPIILGTLFYFAFSNIENSEKMQVIPIAIVEDSEFTQNVVLKEAMKELGDEQKESQIFSITYTNPQEAEQLLQKGEVDGYLEIEDGKVKVVLKENGINQTIIQSVVEEVLQTSKIVENLSQEKIKEQMKSGNTMINYEEIYQNAIQQINETNTDIQDISSDRLSYTMIEFYTLIAMTCLYGATLGMYAINNVLANMSHTGKRISITPIKKGKLLLSTILASYITQLIGLAILFIYTILALHVDYGTQMLPILLLTLVGSLAGLTLGVAVGTLLKANENTKTGIIIAYTMFGCFLSGMMGITMKYVIDKNIPILNRINPANMITDGFYALYYYTTLDRYWFNMISLLIFATIMIVLSFVALRRQKYDNI